MARPGKKGDTAYNARRRFYRNAERYMKQAEKASGATAARYREMARLNLEDAMATYKPGTTQSFAKPIQRIASELGVDIESRRRELQVKPVDKKSEALQKAAITRAEKRREELLDLEGGKSAGALFSARGATLREEEARAIMNSPIGHRIIGGLVEVWQDEAVTVDEVTGETKQDKGKMMQAIFDYFDVSDTASLLEKIEEITGDVLYSHGTVDEMYETVKLMLQRHVASDNSIAA